MASEDNNVVWVDGNMVVVPKGLTKNAPIVDDELIDWVIREEGFLKEPTNIGDGMITLGSGLTDPKWHKLYRERGNKWSSDDNRKAVAEELKKRNNWAERNVPNWEQLPPSARKAMLSYKYNYDFTANNSPKLFDAMKRGDFLEAVRQMDATSKDPKFRKGLQQRREREQNWARQDLLGTSTVVEPPILEQQPDVFNIGNPYTPIIEETVARPVLVPASTNNYVETRYAEPEEWQQADAIAAWNEYARIKKFLDSQKLENQPEPERFNPQGIDYTVGNTKAEGGKLEKPKTWDELSIKEKADMMRVAVENGITTLPEIKERYNAFAMGGIIE